MKIEDMGESSRAYRRMQWRATTRVHRALASGELLAPSLQICVDCGSSATSYDHRDYTKPLDVVPVCASCNSKRRHAVNYVKEVRGLRLPRKVKGNGELNDYFMLQPNAMNPETALDKLIDAGWTYATIAPFARTHRANLLRIHKKGQDATWRVGDAIIKIAKRGRKPPRKCA